MTTTEPERRAFRIPLQSVSMSERRILASKFGINFDVLQVDLAGIPKPEDPDNPTEAEQMAMYREFSRVVGPNEKFALLYLGVKRQIPTASVAQVEEKADAGEWVLDLSDEPSDDEVAAGVPLPPPSGTT